MPENNLEKPSSLDNSFSKQLLIFGDDPKFWDGFGAIEKIDGPLGDTLLAFKDNIQSAIRVGSIPFLLTHSRVMSQRFNQLYIAELIRGTAGSEPSDIEKELAHDRARLKMQLELDESVIVNRHANDVVSIPSGMLSDDKSGFLESANELLRQVLVMTWGAFETCFHDSIRVILNENPALAFGKERKIGKNIKEKIKSLC